MQLTLTQLNLTTDTTTTRIDFDIPTLQITAQIGEKLSLHQILVQQNGFDRITGGRVLSFGVFDDFKHFFW